MWRRPAQQAHLARVLVIQHVEHAQQAKVARLVLQNVVAYAQQAPSVPPRQPARVVLQILMLLLAALLLVRVLHALPIPIAPLAQEPAALLASLARQ